MSDLRDINYDTVQNVKQSRLVEIYRAKLA